MPPQFELVNKALAFIEQNIQNDISVSDVAAQAQLSSWHFQRIFHQMTGETIGAYVRRRRMSCSLDALTSSNRKIIDIALDFQFGSSEAYSRAFKAEYGYSPLEYRKRPRRIVSQKKAALGPAEFAYLTSHIQLVPEIREVPEIFVVGLVTSFPSPLSRRREYMKQIPKVWRHFLRREAEVTNKLGLIKVGLTAAAEGLSCRHIHDDQIDYLAGTPVSSFQKIPQGMTCIVIPSAKYCVFKYKGFHEQTQDMVDYVYSTWLPNSGYKRGPGAEFTWLDHRVHPADPLTSEIEYFFPVQTHLF